MTSGSSRRRENGCRERGRSLIGTACRVAGVLGLVGCAAGPAVVDAPLAARAPPGSTPVRVADERGAIGVRRSAALARELEPADSNLLAHHLAHVEGVVEAPLVLGNDAHLLVDGPATYREMFRAIGAARRRIHLETYILEASESGERLAELLVQKRAKGVEVRVLYDSVGSRETPKSYFDALAAAGVVVCEFNPVSPLRLDRDPRLSVNNRDHRKLLVVDGQVAFTGGINISGVYSAGSFGSRRKAQRREEGWRDTHVLVRGPVVAQFERLFEAAWRAQDCSDPPAAATTTVAASRAGDMAMRVVAADPATGRSELYVALMSALEHSRERAWLTYGYFVPDRPMIEALRAAARRGVDVRLVLPGFSDFWAPFHAGRSHYSDLLAAGVRIFERRDALLHAKTAVIDGVWSSVGSTNLDWRSFVHNLEADVLVLDGGFAGEMEALFGLDEQTSHEVSTEEWDRRGLRARFLEWLARRWEYML